MSLKPSLQAAYKVLGDCVITTDVYLPKPKSDELHAYPVGKDDLVLQDYYHLIKIKCL